MYGGLNNSLIVGCALKWPWLIPVLALGVPVLFYPNACY